MKINSMKRQMTLISVASLLTISTAFGQSYPLFKASEDIDIGNIRAGHLVHGDMWWDADSLPKCEFPKGSGKHVGFASMMAICGRDAANTMLLSAQNYRRSATGSGPLHVAINEPKWSPPDSTPGARHDP